MTRFASSSARLLLPIALFAIVLLALAAGSASAEADAAAGKAKYDMLCTTCHGSGGKGDGPAAAALVPKPRDFTVGDFKYDADKDGTAGSDVDLTLVIQNGAAAYGGSGLMAAWGAILSDAELANIVAFVRGLKQ